MFVSLRVAPYRNYEMSSGNPFGLAEISHYGGMQRVGGKAGGFINKKFFHPSSLRNQEKLWKAMTADSMEKAKQRDAEKRREEERKVEDLRKQMYIAGQAGNASDMLFAGPGRLALSEQASGSGGGKKSEQQKAFDEQRKRRAMVKEHHAAREDAESVVLVSGDINETLEEVEEGEIDSHGIDKMATAKIEKMAERQHRLLVKSQYPEDVSVRGHTAVWGSWYTMEEKQWGFSCCKGTVHTLRCPLAPEDDGMEKEKRPRGERTGKRRKKGGGDSNAMDSQQSAQSSSASRDVVASSIEDPMNVSCASVCETDDSGSAAQKNSANRDAVARIRDDVVDVNGAAPVDTVDTGSANQSDGATGEALASDVKTL